jgi:SET domain-containing protein
MSQNIAQWVEVKESGIHGKGLFAKTAIKKGTVIGRLEGKVVKKDGPHVLWMNDGQQLFQVQNELKYINHNKQPNVAYYDDYTVVALKSIKAGSELVHDYGDDWD